MALKHAPDERPVKKADQKSEIAPARDDEKRRRRKQSLEHGDVPIFGVCTTKVTETGVPDARLKILRRPVR